MNVLTVDFQNTPMKKFPATSRAAEKQWADYLGDMSKEGWQLSTVTPYPLGVETRWMLIFYRQTKPPTARVKAQSE